MTPAQYESRSEHKAATRAAKGGNMKPFPAYSLKPCPCGCTEFYMPVTLDKVPEDVTCVRCRKGFNPYTGEYVVDES